MICMTAALNMEHSARTFECRALAADRAEEREGGMLRSLQGRGVRLQAEKQKWRVLS